MMTVVTLGAVILTPALRVCEGVQVGVLACLREQLGGGRAEPESVGAPEQPAPEVAPPEASRPDAEAPMIAETPRGTAESEPLGPAPSHGPGAGEARDGFAGAPAEQRPEVDAVRVEPDGSVVIAGRGKPGSDVSIYANGELFGTVTAEPDGDWAMLADGPLPPGGTAITAGDADSDLLAERAFVVVIDPERPAEPQVIPTAPDETAALLLERSPRSPDEDVRGPPTGETAEAEVADLSTAPPNEAREPADTFEAPGLRTPALPLVPVGERAAREVAVALAGERLVSPVVSAPEPPEAAVPPLVPVGERAAREVAAALAAERFVLPFAAVPEPPETATPPMVPVGERAAREVAVALVSERDVSPVVSVPEPPEAATPPLVPVGERAAREVAVALAAERDVSPVVAPATAVEAPTVPSAADRARREVAAALDLARAREADERETLPERGEPSTPEPSAPETDRRALEVDVAAVARGWIEALTAVGAVGSPPPQSMTARPDKPAPSEGQTALEALEPARGDVPPPVEVAIRPAVPVTASEEPAAPSAGEIAPGHEPGIAAVGPPEEDSAPTIRAMAISDVDLARGRPGKIVVQPGDTLWDIADRVYGDGSKYQTIYRANRDVIPRPGRLMPGQVLEIPLVYD